MPQQIAVQKQQWVQLGQALAQDFFYERSSLQPFPAKEHVEKYRLQMSTISCVRYLFVDFVL